MVTHKLKLFFWKPVIPCYCLNFTFLFINNVSSILYVGLFPSKTFHSNCPFTVQDKSNFSRVGRNFRHADIIFLSTESLAADMFLLTVKEFVEPVLRVNTALKRIITDRARDAKESDFAV